jgi:flagellar motor switch protein FliN
MPQQDSEFARFFSASKAGAASVLAADDASGTDSTLRSLPPYSRSLLRISVPVMVTLAGTRLSLKRILQLGPGSIIPLEKSCEAPLTLQVGSHDLAVGEAVKVGDKFGLRISSMVMPREKFLAIRGKREEQV